MCRNNLSPQLLNPRPQGCPAHNYYVKPRQPAYPHATHALPVTNNYLVATHTQSASETSSAVAQSAKAWPCDIRVVSSWRLGASGPCVTVAFSDNTSACIVEPDYYIKTQSEGLQNRKNNSCSALSLYRFPLLVAHISARDRLWPGVVNIVLCLFPMDSDLHWLVHVKIVISKNVPCTHHRNIIFGTSIFRWGFIVYIRAVCLIANLSQGTAKYHYQKRNKQTIAGNWIYNTYPIA